MLEKSNGDMLKLRPRKSQQPAPSMRQYQPNYFGTQINIENLQLENEVEQGDSPLDNSASAASEAVGEAAKFMYLSEGVRDSSRSNSIGRLVQSYFGLGEKNGYPPNVKKSMKKSKPAVKKMKQKEKSRKNSPMLIKVLKSEL